MNFRTFQDPWEPWVEVAALFKFMDALAKQRLPHLDVFNIGAIILRSGNSILLCDPGLDVLHFTVELEQFLGLNQFASPCRRQLHQLAVLALDVRLFVTNVGRVKVATRDKTVAQRRQLSDLLVEVFHIEFYRVQFLQQSLVTSAVHLNIQVQIHTVPTLLLTTNSRTFPGPRNIFPRLS